MERVRNVGELVEVLLARYRRRYGDEELARLATAATLNELLAERAAVQERHRAA